MHISNAGIDLIKQYAVCHLAAYSDAAGVWRIGYGHTSDVQSDTTITRNQAEAYLLTDIERCESCIDQYVSVPLTQNQFDALVSFVYDVGPKVFRGSYLLSFLNAGQYIRAAYTFEEYAAEPPDRRLAEKALFLGYPGGWLGKFLRWMQT